MTHVITQNCCNDASCVPVCPVNCIHPTPDEPGYGTTEMLYIDPDACIDCGACVSVCPVSAITPDYELSEDDERYVQLNQSFYDDPSHQDYNPTPQVLRRRRWDGADVGPLRVAVAGTGPAASYAAEELLAQRGLDVSVDMFERLATPWGLVRHGVAPDHQSTKAVAAGFEKLLRNPRLRLFLNVEVGRDVGADQLRQRYHAVVYAIGAPDSRPLGIPGEDLPGSRSAAEFVAWVNGHPDVAARTFDLSGERAVVIGNGNVALDVARILLSDVERLARTDIADHALAALRQSTIREVVVVGRRSVREAAFTVPELAGLGAVPELTVRVDGPVLDASAPDADDGDPDDWTTSSRRYKEQLLDELVARPRSTDRAVVFRFLSSPVELVGDDRVREVVLERNRLTGPDGAPTAVGTGELDRVETGLVLSAVGFHGASDAVPTDERGVVPNEGGRVVDPGDGRGVPGVYVTGWARRGPSGMIGTNKHDARGTVAALLDDHAAGLLPAPVDLSDLADELPERLDAAAWKAIDEEERRAGRAVGRPRVKFTDASTLIAKGRAVGTRATAGADDRS